MSRILTARKHFCIALALSAACLIIGPALLLLLFSSLSLFLPLLLLLLLYPSAVSWLVQQNVNNV